MEIKQLYNENEYDIFLGDGWLNWLRVRVNRNRSVDVLNKADHIDPNPKLLELIYYKVKKYAIH